MRGYVIVRHIEYPEMYGSDSLSGVAKNWKENEAGTFVGCNFILLFPFQWI